VKIAVTCGAPKIVGMAFGVAGLTYLDSGVLTADKFDPQLVQASHQCSTKPPAGSEYPL
jgi:hypothetical protein